MPNVQQEIEAQYRAFHARWMGDREALLEELAVLCPFCGKRRPRRPVYVLPRVVGNVSKPGPCTCEEYREAMGAETLAILEARKTEARVAAGLVGRRGKATLAGFERDTPERKVTCEAVEQWAGQVLDEVQVDRPWLLLTGKYGTGKSHLAAAVLNEALERYWTRAYFVGWTAHLAALRSTFGPDSKITTNSLTSHLPAARLLVLDDLDKAKPSDWTKDQLYSVLDERYVLELPTVLTCNCTTEELVHWTGPALLDRMTEMCLVVRFAGPSYRGGHQW